MTPVREALLRIVRMGHELTDEVSRHLKKFEISEPQYNVLRILKGAKTEKLSVQEIGSRMIQKNSNVTRIIDKLVARKLVLREECPTNRRKMDISITLKGQEFLKILTKEMEKLEFKQMNSLKNNEIEKLIELLDKINGNEKDK